MAKKKQSFEQKLKQLDEIVDLLESGDVPLDDLIVKYEEGILLAKELKEFLNKAELKVTDITKQNQSIDDSD